MSNLIKTRTVYPFDLTNNYHWDWECIELGVSVRIDDRRNIVADASDKCSQPPLPSYSPDVKSPPGSPGTSAFGLNSRALGRELGYDANWMIVGDEANDVAGANSGSAFLYKWNTSTKVWDYKCTLQPSGPAAGRKFGYAVAVSSYYGYAFVSSIWDGTHGTITCFKRSSDTVWNQVREIEIAETGACQSNIAQVSAYNGKNFYVGVLNSKVNYYTWATGDNWSLFRSIAAPVSSVAFGQNIVSCYLDNWELFVSDHLADGGKGRVYEYLGGTDPPDASYAPADLQAGDHFGEHMSNLESGDLIVGAPGASSGAGAVYIYSSVNPQGLSGYWCWPWEMRRKLTSPNAAAGAHFGQSVGNTAGDWFAIAEPDATVGVNANAGRVYVYSLKGNAWTPTLWRTLEGTTAGQKLGSALYMQSHNYSVNNGDWFNLGGPTLLMIGDTEDHLRVASWSFYNPLFEAGALYVFDEDGELVQHIDPSSFFTVAQMVEGFGPSYYGGNISICGDWLAAGAPALSYTNTGLTWAKGSVSLFKWNSGTGQYDFKQRIVGSVSPLAGAFGHSVHITANRLVVGAPLAAAGGTQQGEVYVFTRSGDTWSEYQRIVSPSPQYQARFGRAVRLSADGMQLFVGTGYYDGGGYTNRGGAWAFIDSGASFGAGTELPPGSHSHASMYFGDALWGDTDLVYVGAPEYDGTVSSEGLVIAFRRSGGSWSESEVLHCPFPHDYTGNGFGYEFAVTATEMLIGAPYFYNYAGEMYRYLRGNPPVYQQRISFLGGLYDTGPDGGRTIGFITPVGGDPLAAAGLPEKWSSARATYGAVSLLGPQPVLSVSPSTIDQKGGTLLTITSDRGFTKGLAYEVHMGPLGTSADPVCYGGEGNGYYCYSPDGVSLYAVSPPVINGTLGQQKVSITACSPADILVVEAPFRGTVLNSRRCHPPWVGVGARRLELEAQRALLGAPLPLVRSANDEISMTDQVVRAANQWRRVADQITAISDVLVESDTYLRAASDTISMGADVAAGLITIGREASDTIVMAEDNVQRAVDGARSVSDDPVGTEDSVSAGFDRVLAVGGDTISLGDAVARGVDGARSVSDDPIVLTDDVSVEKT